MTARGAERVACETGTVLAGLLENPLAVSRRYSSPDVPHGYANCPDTGALRNSTELRHDGDSNDARTLSDLMAERQTADNEHEGRSVIRDLSGSAVHR